MAEGKKKGKSYATRSDLHFKSRTFTWDAERGCWSGWFSYTDPHGHGRNDIDAVVHAVSWFITDLENEFNIWFDGDSAIDWGFRPLYDAAERSVSYSLDVCFLRFWLDQIVEQEGYAIWNYVFNNTRKEKGDKAADKLADATLKKFHDIFS